MILRIAGAPLSGWPSRSSLLPSQATTIFWTCLPLAYGPPSRTPQHRHASSSATSSPVSSSMEEMRARRRWLAALERTTFTTDHFPITFSRSSGPGGQNVNRLNTKATVRVDLAKVTTSATAAGADGSSSSADHDAASQSGHAAALDLSPGKRWLPKSVSSELVAHSPYYVQSSHSLSISSMRHRTAPANAQDALEKLHEHIHAIASQSLVGETSAQQREKVQGLQRKESRKMEKVKKKRSDVKAGRGKVAL